MKKVILTTLIIVVLTSCSNNTYDNHETSTMTGEVTNIHRDFIFADVLYVDEKPFHVKNISDFEVGQRVKVTYITTTKTEAWVAEDIIVEDVEILE
ncbi:membrane lipoprotein lipid attachment site-containing protein [Pontibacillus yanchengensis]|uniref:DUF3221 domain-containing protein n=1 Tax=Pontibacillus yanchengensis Y32 TaxID=1385514 RepID=A0A0A2T8Z4_9BACI|nr:membrane lipoprotein lipid attachment site-containing protein [Pontibacillus yanchengensis]KGP72029.1 hypothetical protein N782_14465 [Pontibacillus yanchengensis Y32]